MKYRYYKITSTLIYGKDHIGREDLVSVKNRSTDVLMDTENNSYFDCEKNEWVEIPGDRGAHSL